MKVIKKFLGLKIHVWVLFLFLIIFGIGGIWGYNKFQSNVKEESTTSVYYLEKVNEVVFLNVGIEKIVPLSNSTKVFNIPIPYSKKTKIVKLSFIAKFGIKKPVNIESLSENKYKITIPKFEKIGFDIAPGNWITTYDGQGELLSSSTPDVDTKEATNKVMSDKETKKYLKKYNSMIKESATKYYTDLFKSINSDYSVEVQFAE